MRFIVRVLLTLALATTGIGAIARQAPRDTPVIVPLDGTGVISGRVVSADTAQRPVRRAVVTLTMPESGRSVRAFTQDDGSFAFRHLPTARYTLSIAKPAYVTQVYGARAASLPGTTVALKDGQTTDLGAIPLTRGGVITGTVLSPLGKPSANAVVIVAPIQTVNGEIKMSSAGSTQQTNADDRGIYRVAGLVPGTYVVRVASLNTDNVRLTTNAEFRWASQPAGAAPSPPAVQPAQYAPVFYPGAVDASGATPVTVAGGEERTGVDIVLQFVAAIRVSGRLIGPDGQPLSRVPIRVMPSASFEGALSPLVPNATSAVGIALPGGTFAIPGVVPGSYKLFAAAMLPMDPPSPSGPQVPRQIYWAMTDIRASGADLDGITLTMQPGLKVTGTMVFERGSTPPPEDPSRLRFTLAPVGAAFLQSMSPVTAADGTFTIDAVLPGPMRAAMSMTTSGWIAKSAMLNGKDLFDEPVDIRQDTSGLIVTFVDHLSQISGTLVDGTGQPAPQILHRGVLDGPEDVDEELPPDEGHEGRERRQVHVHQPGRRRLLPLRAHRVRPGDRQRPRVPQPAGARRP